MTRFGYAMGTFFSVLGVVIAAFIPTPLRLGLECLRQRAGWPL